MESIEKLAAALAEDSPEEEKAENDIIGQIAQGVASIQASISDLASLISDFQIEHTAGSEPEAETETETDTETVEDAPATEED